MNRRQVGRGYDGLLPPTDTLRAVDNHGVDERRKAAVNLADSAIRHDAPGDLAAVLAALGLLDHQAEEWG